MSPYSLSSVLYLERERAHWCLFLKAHWSYSFSTPPMGLQWNLITSRPPDVKNWLIGKDLMLGKVEGRRRRGRQRLRWLYTITNSMDTNLSKLQEIVADRGAWHAIVHGVTKGLIWLTDWTTATTLRPHVQIQPLL